MNAMTDALLRAGLIQTPAPGVAALWDQDRPESRIVATLLTVHRPLREIAQAVVESLSGRGPGQALPVEPGDREVGATGGLHIEFAGQGSPARMIRLRRVELPPQDWRLLVDLVDEGPQCRVAVLVEGRPPQGLAPFGDLCARLVGLGADAGGHVVRREPEIITGRIALGELADFLLDPTRALPLVLITAFTKRNGEFALDPDELSWRLVGVAHVAATPIWSDTFELSSRLAKLGCYAGGIRIYWPEMTRNDYLDEHPLIFPDAVGPTTIDDIAARVHRRSVAHHREFQERAELMESRRQSTAARIAASPKPGGLPPPIVPSVEVAAAPPPPALVTPPSAADEPADAFAPAPSAEPVAAEPTAPALDLVPALVEHIATLEQVAATREQVVAELTQRIMELEGQIVVLRTALSAREDPYSGVEVALPLPTSFELAILQAGEFFANELVITEAAMKAASKINSADNSHEKLWKALCDLTRAVRRWRANDLPAGFAAALREAGWDMHGVSEQAVFKHVNDYCFSWGGGLVRLDASIKISKGERVYWHMDEAGRRLVLNHIGHHLPDSTTGG